MDYLNLTNDELSVAHISDLVSSHSCGAISIFVGTTRDNFEGKIVAKLEYEAYESMAIAALQRICAEARERWNSIVNIAIYHRLGTVPVKEASIVIAISSPHRSEALSATQFCIDNVKEKVPIWKKEIYKDDSSPEWKENKEYEAFPETKSFILPESQEVKMPYTPAHLIQIKASNEEIEERIERFMKCKRDEINRCNVKDFCMKDIDVENENSCARIDSVLIRRKDSKGHLQVNRVYNSYCYRDQNDMEYLEKHIPPNGIEERIRNLESQLSLSTPVPRSVYERLKEIENRLLYLESVSPEYLQFWEKNINGCKAFKKKKTFNIGEIDRLILDLECKRARHSS